MSIYIPKTTGRLSTLQDFFDRQQKEDEERKANFIPAPLPPESPKDIRIEPTAVDLMLMEEYERGVYHGD